jgi:hypothetical protein
MKNPNHPIFRPSYPSEDSCIVAAHHANEQSLRRQPSSGGCDTKQEPESCTKPGIPRKDHRTGEEERVKYCPKKCGTS